MLAPVSGDLPTVGHAHGLVEAAIAVSLLEAAGIVVVPAASQTVSVAWHWTDALGGIELRVPSAQAAAAIDILSRFEPQYPRSRRLIRVLGFVIAFIALQIPPPSSGFFVVRLPEARREATPLPRLF